VFVEASRSDFVSAYIGETSQRVQKIFEQAAGGVLFIDEAGTLVTGADGWDRGGTEALGAIVWHMDCHPETVVIFATYDDEMEKLFTINEGLKSRISNIITFESYSTEQLIEIFRSMAKSKGYAVAPGYKKVIAPHFDKMRKMESFGNGRDVRKLLESAIGVMAVQNKEFSTTIPLSAIRKAIAEALENQPAEKNRIGFNMVGLAVSDA
jgi:ATP-dependent 26S proteasome regulatory subunit